MKRIFTTLLTGLLAATALAQSHTTSFTVDGIKVIFRPTVKSIISVKMFYRGGVANYTPEQSGIEDFALRAATECGTQTYNSNAFRDMADKYGVTIGASSTYDYGTVTLECVSKYFDQGWNLFASAITQPVFEEAEVELLKNKMLSHVNLELTNPDRHLEQMMMTNAFAGTVYVTDPEGTKQSINQLDAAKLKAYYQQLLNKNRMFLVVAGHIDSAELVAKVKAAFSLLPVREYTAPVYRTPLWNDNKLLVEDRQIPTNYVGAITNAPHFSNPLYLPYRMGISVLSGGMFGILRTRMNLSYDPEAHIEILQMPYAVMTLSTTDPKQAVPVMIALAKRVKGIDLSGSSMMQIKSNFITSNYLRMQSSNAITDNLGLAEVMGGWQLADQLPDIIENVSAAQITDALQRYLRGVRWVYLGNTGKADEAGKAFEQKVE